MKVYPPVCGGSSVLLFPPLDGTHPLQTAGPRKHRSTVTCYRGPGLSTRHRGYPVPAVVLCRVFAQKASGRRGESCGGRCWHLSFINGH